MLNSVSDVAMYAEMKFNIDYNSFINAMNKDGILPFYEQKTLSVYKGVGSDYGWSKEVSEVFDAYVEEYGKQELTD